MNRRTSGGMVGFLMLIGIVFFIFAQVGATGGMGINIAGSLNFVIGIVVMFVIINVIRRAAMGSQAGRRFRDRDEKEKSEDLDRPYVKQEPKSIFDNDHRYDTQVKTPDQRHTNRTQPLMGAVTAEETEICQECHKPVSKSTIYCPHCGARVVRMVNCVNCGHPNPEMNVICEKCHKFIH